MVPEPVYLSERLDIDLRPISKFVVLLTHHNGVQEVVTASCPKSYPPFQFAGQAFKIAQRFMDTGKYADIKILPVRTVMDVAKPIAYEDASEATLALQGGYKRINSDRDSTQYVKEESS